MAATVSIIIRAYNEEKHIGRLLSGIIQQDFKDYEIILVDSGSTDSTINIASQYPVRIVQIKSEDFSFGYALNTGCKAANGEFLVFASAHVYPQYRDWLEKLIAPFTNQNLAIVYGKQRGNEITKFSEHQVFRKWFPDKSCLDQQHPFCNNANLAIRKKVWEQVPYDEALTGLEDLDSAKKIMTLGYKIAYSAEAEIIHVHEETSYQIYNRYQREAIALKSIVKEEKFGMWGFFRLLVGNVFGGCIQAINQKKLLLNFNGIIKFRLMQFWGTYKGFRQADTVDKDLWKRFFFPNQLVLKKTKTESTNRNEKLIDYSSTIQKANVGIKNT